MRRKTSILTILIVFLALFGVFSNTFAETAKEALDKGIEYYKQERYEEAMANFNRAIEIDPGCAEAYYNRGRAYGSYDIFSDNSDQAIADFSKAIELNPSYVDAYNWRGMTYELDKNNYDRAIADFSKAIELNPNYVNGYINRGSVYDSKGEYDKAISDYNKAIEIEPNNPKHYGSSRAWAYFYKGDYDRAWVDVHKAELLGGKVDPDFLNKLKKASGRQN